MLKWLQPPRLRVGDSVEETEPRRVTWMELFYDLIFVVAVAELAHRLGQDVSPAGFFGFVGLFVPVWWAWIGTTFYANRFDTDTVVRRILMALQMLAIAALAVNIHHGFTDSAVGFALAYAVARMILVFEYWWAGHCNPDARPLTQHYAAGFAIAAACWLVSAIVPPPWRFVLWIVGLTVDFATPLTGQHHQMRFLPHAEHLPERFGLFTIIVLGEAVIAVVKGVAEVHWSLLSAGCAALGFAIAVCLWWIYFDNVDGSSLRAVRTGGNGAAFQVWLYVHLPLVIGIVGTGVGVEHLIVQEGARVLTDPDRWLLCGSVALCLLALAVLHRTGVIFKCKVRTQHRFIGAGLVMLVAIAGAVMPPIGVIGSLALIGAVQVVLDLRQGRPAHSQVDAPILS